MKGEMPLCRERCHYVGRDAAMKGEMPLCRERCRALKVSCELKKEIW